MPEVSAGGEVGGDSGGEAAVDGGSDEAGMAGGYGADLGEVPVDD